MQIKLMIFKPKNKTVVRTHFHKKYGFTQTHFDIQYCAKVTQAKCANFFLCLCELSRKVCVKVRVTIQGLLSKISLEQRTLFHQIFGTK